VSSTGDTICVKCNQPCGNKIHWIGGTGPLCLGCSNKVGLSIRTDNGENGAYTMIDNAELATIRSRLTAATERCKALEEGLIAIRDYEPQEVVCDEFAYTRMVESYRDAARRAMLAGEEVDGE